MNRIARSATFLLLIAGPLMSQTWISTLSMWDGNNFISSFGVPNTATYGQTITVPAGGASITSFSFEIGYCSAAVPARGEIYAWDGSKATGSSLFESSAATTIPASSAYQLVTFNTGGVTLPQGVYILFATTSRDQAGAANSSCRFGAVADSVYGGGAFKFMNNTADTTAWTSGTWSSIAEDLAFQINGTAQAVPAASPETLAIMVIGLIALGLFALSRRRIAAS